MKALFNSIHPISMILFALAIFVIFIGAVTGFEHKVLHCVSVSGCIGMGLVIQKRGGIF